MQPKKKFNPVLAGLIHGVIACILGIALGTLTNIVMVRFLNWNFSRAFIRGWAIVPYASALIIATAIVAGGMMKRQFWIPVLLDLAAAVGTTYGVRFIIFRYGYEVILWRLGLRVNYWVGYYSVLAVPFLFVFSMLIMVITYFAAKEMKANSRNALQVQNPYGQSPYVGQNPYVQSPYAGQNPYVQSPSAGQSPYVQSPYVQSPQAGQNPYVQSPYAGQSPYVQGAGSYAQNQPGFGNPGADPQGTSYSYAQTQVYRTDAKGREGRNSSGSNSINNK